MAPWRRGCGAIADPEGEALSRAVPARKAAPVERQRPTTRFRGCATDFAQTSAEERRFTPRFIARRASVAAWSCLEAPSTLPSAKAHQPCCPRRRTSSSASTAAVSGRRL
jgi:hypothetical protein